MTLATEDDVGVDEEVEFSTLEVIKELELLSVELEGATELDEIIELLLVEDVVPEEASGLGCVFAKTKPVGIKINKTSKIMTTGNLILNIYVFPFC